MVRIKGTWGSKPGWTPEQPQSRFSYCSSAPRLSPIEVKLPETDCPMGEKRLTCVCVFQDA
jgi:hypothetical protein